MKTSNSVPNSHLGRAVLLTGCLLTGFEVNAAEASGHSLREALTFHASFDGKTDAEFAKGDIRIYSAPSMKQPRTGTPGLPLSKVVTHAKGEGKFGDSLKFNDKASEMVFFEAAKNMDYKTQNWSGTVSFWLRLNPDEDLKPGFTDPIQITPRDWNDAAFFVEFGKDEKPRHFRLGVYADFKVWNPENREWGKIPFHEKPLVSVEQPPFSRERWTHVLFTFSNFNTGRKDSEAKLYLNGVFQGGLKDREQTFTWDPAKSKIMLGLSYIGYFDELAIFNRALNEQEIKTVYQLSDGIRSLK